MESYVVEGKTVEELVAGAKNLEEKVGVYNAEVKARRGARKDIFTEMGELEIAKKEARIATMDEQKAKREKSLEDERTKLVNLKAAIAKKNAGKAAAAATESAPAAPEVPQ